MQRDRVGRLIPSRPIEHLFYWPLLAVALYGVYLLANYVVVLTRPADKAFGSWMMSAFGDWALAIFAIVFFPACALLYLWGARRKPTDAPPLAPP